mmetsp:Transcript_20843/g.51116  ORF Transcript_20843/g.51116 Transcript_20843/m.51116 type:complete len:156 (+) Transcript_20843:151-618(+)
MARAYVIQTENANVFMATSAIPASFSAQEKTLRVAASQARTPTADASKGTRRGASACPDTGGLPVSMNALVAKIPHVTEMEYAQTVLENASATRTLKERRARLVCVLTIAMEMGSVRTVSASVTTGSCLHSATHLRAQSLTSQRYMGKSGFIGSR